MPKNDLLRLVRVQIDGLFEHYDHAIDLNREDRVTLLHGENGVGKTTTLRLIHALMRSDFTAFFHVPFARMLLEFSDQSKLGVTKNNDDREYATVTLEDASGSTESISARPSTAQRLAARQKFLDPHPTIRNAWVDTRDGEVLLEEEVLDRYGPWRPRQRAAERSGIEEFLDGTGTYFIQVSRLLQPFEPSHSAIALRTVQRRRQLARVVECGGDYRLQLRNAMARYGREAQRLDQTFPERLVLGNDHIPEPRLRERLAALDHKMASLKDLGILGEEGHLPFKPIRVAQLDDTQSKAMALYVKDTEQKLAPLDDFANRTRRLLDSLNQKYRYKSIRLDRSEGLVAEGETGTTLGLGSLSDGEQHELVLNYELLFRVKPNTVVLIDEPELSLHVSWQKQFLPDLLETVQLSEIDAVVATHSPFIAGFRDDLMVRLGDPL